MNMMYIEDCCEILDSMRVPITASDRKKGEYPYYGANGIQDYVSDYIFDDELVLLAEDGGNFGSKEKPIAYRVSGKCWVNNHAHVLKPKAGLNVDYLCYSLMFYNVEGIINGATRQKLTQSAMRKMKIPVRTMKEQIQIVDKLNRIIRIKEQRKQELSELDTLIKARFVEMFGDIGSNSYKWDKELLGVLCDVRDGTHDSPKYCQNGYPLLTSKNVTTGTIDLTSCSLISEEDYKRINERSRVDVGDIIMPMIGTVGKPIIVDIEPNFAIKNVALIKFKDNTKVTNVYIRTLLQSDYFKNVVFNKARGGTQKFISLGDIRKIDILLPPLSLQNEFATFVQQIDKLRVVIQKSLDEAQYLFDSLMQEYFG